jgi:hypothetical protein
VRQKGVPHAGFLFYRASCTFCNWRTKRFWLEEKAHIAVQTHMDKCERRTNVSDYVGFVDVMGSNAHLVPAVPGLTFILLYATGSDGIEATAAEIARFKDAGIGVGMLDQTASLSVFAAGLADVADVEPLAGTIDAVVAAVLKRQAHGWQSTIYVSQSNLEALTDALIAAKIDLGLVWFGVANYDYSEVTAEAALAANESWAYVQFGSPGTNGDTKVPGTDVTLAQAQCDIDVGKVEWVDQFLIKKPAPPAPKGPFRHVLAKDQTVESFAASRNANTHNMFLSSMKLWTPADELLIENGEMVVYTQNP